MSPNYYIGPFSEAHYSDGVGAPTVVGCSDPSFCVSGITITIPSSQQLYGPTQISLSVQGSDANDSYMWEFTGPNPASDVFSPNGTGAASTADVTLAGGVYSIRVTIGNTEGKSVTTGIIIHFLQAS